MAQATPYGDRKQCIEFCLDCHRTCIDTAMAHCLEMGGDYVQPAHFRLMMNCADLCRTTADFLLSASEFSAQLCALCAEVCEACADSCRDIGDMDNCVLACDLCADSCAAMSAQGVPVLDRPAQLEPVLTHPRARLP